MAKHPKVVAIGEIGLDYHYDFSPRDTQRLVFERQILLAKKLSLPIVIHCREAHGDTYEPVSYTHLDVYKRQHINGGKYNDVIVEK